MVGCQGCMVVRGGVGVLVIRVSPCVRVMNMVFV